MSANLDEPTAQQDANHANDGSSTPASAAAPSHPTMGRREVSKIILGVGVASALPVIWPRAWETPFLRGSRASAQCLSAPTVTGAKVTAQSDTSVAVNWDNPSTTPARCPSRPLGPTTVQYSTNRFTEAAQRNTQSVTVGVFTTTVTGLSPDTTYFFWLKNELRGSAEFSGPHVATTFGLAAPTSVAAPTITERGITTVSWQVPDGYAGGFELTILYDNGTRATPGTVRVEKTQYEPATARSAVIAPLDSYVVRSVSINGQLGNRRSTKVTTSSM